MNNYFGGDGYEIISHQRCAVLLLFNVDGQRFLMSIGWSKRSFCNHGVGDERILIKYVENNVAKSALVLCFVGVPKFHDVVIWDDINELISKNGLQSKGHVKHFLASLCVASNSALLGMLVPLGIVGLAGIMKCDHRRQS